MEKELTAEEFFRNKLKEIKKCDSDITLSREHMNCELAMRWAHEFKESQNSSLLIEVEQLKKDKMEFAIDFALFVGNNYQLLRDGVWIRQGDDGRINPILYTNEGILSEYESTLNKIKK